MLTLLDLLMMGCTVQFPSGLSMKGDLDLGYIELSVTYGDEDPETYGLRDLTSDGVKKALEDEKRFANEITNTENE